MNKPPCSECQKPLVRRGGECTGNWKRRVTCSPACAIKRNNKLRAWTEADIAIAVRMRADGCDYETIGQRLTRRRAGNAVRKKLEHPSTPVASNKKSNTIPRLKCGKPFASVDKCRNRICAKCNYRNQEAYDNTACVGDLV